MKKYIGLIAVVALFLLYSHINKKTISEEDAELARISNDIFRELNALSENNDQENKS